jgi:hypothetical protein
MASLLAFLSAYPYHQYPQNPTIRGRGDGRGSCISDMNVFGSICDCPIWILSIFSIVDLSISRICAIANSQKIVGSNVLREEIGSAFGVARKRGVQVWVLGERLGPIHKDLRVGPPLYAPQEGQAV